MTDFEDLIRVASKMSDLIDKLQAERDGLRVAYNDLSERHQKAQEDIAEFRWENRIRHGLPEEREARKFSRDGEEPPGDVHVLWDSEDRVGSFPYLVRVDSDWAWSDSVGIPNFDCVRKGPWKNIAIVSTARMLEEVV